MSEQRVIAWYRTSKLNAQAFIYLLVVDVDGWPAAAATKVEARGSQRRATVHRVRHAGQVVIRATVGRHWRREVHRQDELSHAADDTIHQCHEAYS